MSDKEIIDLLIEHDEKVTHEFFHVRCHNLFMSIIRSVYLGPVDEDECVNEFYLYLMENDAARLRQFEGRSTLLQWLKVTAIRFFIRKKKQGDGVTEDETHEPELPIRDTEGEDTAERVAARMDVERLLAMIRNERYVYVIRRLMLEEASNETVAEELHVNVSNLYNIKKRAMENLTMVALKDRKRYGTGY